MYCYSCNCYGARTRITIEKDGFISKDEIEKSANAKQEAAIAWNRRSENETD